VPEKRGKADEQQIFVSQETCRLVLSIVTGGDARSRSRLWQISASQDASFHRHHMISTCPRICLSVFRIGFFPSA